MYAGDKLSVSNPRPDGVQYLVDVIGPDPETVMIYGWKAVENFLAASMPAWMGCGIESISPARPIAGSDEKGKPTYTYGQTYRLT